MRALDAREVRDSLVNCSKGERSRVALPDLAAVLWDDLDFLGWQDAAGSQRAYLVAEHEDRLVGIVLRQSGGGPGDRRSTLCQLCVTPHSGGGVALGVARKTGAAGRKGDSTGLYTCRDLRCSLYVRRKADPGVPRLRETLSVEAAVERCRTNLDAFLRRVLVA